MSALRISKDELATVAFELLSSSTIGRYKRMALEAAERSPLKARLMLDSSFMSELVDQSIWLWREVAKSKLRDVSEVELSVILGCLRDVVDSTIDDLLHSIGISTLPVAAWLAAFARSLLADRRASSSFKFCESESFPTGVIFVSGGFLDNAQLLTTVTRPIEIQPYTFFLPDSAEHQEVDARSNASDEDKFLQAA